VIPWAFRRRVVQQYETPSLPEQGCSYLASYSANRKHSITRHPRRASPSLRPGLSFRYTQVHARDLGQWENTDPAIRKWFQALMRPDVPTSSCCGEADAYWADVIHVRGGKTYVTVTDDRPDEPLGRPHVDVGTEIEVPDEKLKWDKSNPTGHGILFLSRNNYVFCYVQPGGV
jgi:hypothetical protein